uniref:Uncharacterized protein n=1 Tax=Knipowitschia caucasica TaxID=637954 RepID=A0AAV2L846_KNICA
MSSHPPVSRCQLIQNTAVCDHRQLSSVPQDLPQNTEELQLNYNHITTLMDGSLNHYPSLKTLSLACNQLQTIQPTAFQHLPVLTSLNLANNDLYNGYEDASAALKYLQSLKALDLSENKLNEENVMVLLENLTTVEYLNLSGNLMQRLDENIFRYLHHLKELDLQQNILFEIDNAFHSNHKLQRLDLAFNYLPCLTDFHMSQLKVTLCPKSPIRFFKSGLELLI